MQGVDDVQVDLAAAVIKAKSANLMISSWQALEERPEFERFEKNGTEMEQAILFVDHSISIHSLFFLNGRPLNGPFMGSFFDAHYKLEQQSQGTKDCLVHLQRYYNRMFRRQGFWIQSTATYITKARMSPFVIGRVCQDSYMYFPWTQDTDEAEWCSCSEYAPIRLSVIVHPNLIQLHK